MSELAPVQIVHVRDHPFEKPPKGKRGCQLVKPDGKVCGRMKQHPLHHGPPPSMNMEGLGRNEFVYRNAKKYWQQMLCEKLEASDLPHGIGGVFVEGTAVFPDRIKRDQGNFRYFIEKALGDALAKGNELENIAPWIEDDTWDRYEFGRLMKAYEKGVARLELVIFPQAGLPSKPAPEQTVLAIPDEPEETEGLLL